MKIRHYPGKAVINDPAWLEMDIPNSTRGLQYEANWLDAQRNLSSSSSSNSSDGKNNQDIKYVSKLGKYQNLLSRNNNNGLIDDTSSKASSMGSLRLKYHSDKYLALANSKLKKDNYNFYNDDYYLPSQTRLKREISLKSIEDVTNGINETKTVAVTDCDNVTITIKTNLPRAKPRTSKSQNDSKENFRNVIDDLEKQINKKSVRFNDKSTEISYGSDNNECNQQQTATKEIINNDDVLNELNENGNEVEKTMITINPIVNDETKHTSTSEDDDDDEEEEVLTQERVNEWIDDQNKYIVTINVDDDGQYEEDYMNEKKKSSSLNRNDSGYYENTTKRVRQRLPPKQLYSSSNSSNSNSKSDSEDVSIYDENDDIYKIYKNGNAMTMKNHEQHLKDNCDLKQRVNSSKIQRGNDNNDFCIPRPKLIVPVHSYGVRKRKTGNLQRQSYADCNDTDGVSNSNLYSTYKRPNKKGKSKEKYLYFQNRVKDINKSKSI